jgi:hypothetical protein
MLHALKKKTAASTAAARGVNPTADFVQMKNKLSLVKRNLMHADKKMVDADLMWKQQLAAQRSFAEDFCDGFVADEGDHETFAVLAEFTRGANERYDHFVRSTTKEDETFARMHVQLRVYLNEIMDVEKRYAELVTAKSEVSRYQKKVDGIELRKKVNDLKKSRNLQKMDAERERYGELTAEIVAQQKATYAKAAVCHRMALCAYWSAHSKHIEVLSRSMERTASWAHGVEDEMLAIDVATLDLLESDGEAGSIRSGGSIGSPAGESHLTASPAARQLASPTASQLASPVATKPPNTDLLARVPVLAA